ncbi:uncharacterized protein TNCV_1692481 [Trichonephila clavipes]|nr:uncharacterized protein TNCV_1692481 [Trichonephila clavipes]
MISWSLNTLEWDLIQHPSCSPDMVSSDYYLFSYLQQHLDDKIFSFMTSSFEWVNRFLDSRTPQFFAEEIEKFLKNWQTIVDLKGDNYPH